MAHLLAGERKSLITEYTRARMDFAASTAGAVALKWMYQTAKTVIEGYPRLEGPDTGWPEAFQR